MLIVMEFNRKMDFIMKCHDELKNTLDLVNKNNDQITTKYYKNVTRYENTLKEMNTLLQENKKLEEYISEIKNYCEIIEKTKQENDYLQMVYDKNVSTISKLKKEMLNSNQVSFDKLLPLGLDDDILGFDSVSLTVSKSEIQIDPQYESYECLYHKIQNDSTDFHITVTSLFDSMKQTNMIIETEIDYLKSVARQTTETVEVIKNLLNRILQDDQEAIQEMVKKQCILGRIKLDISTHLDVLKLDLKSLGNREKIKIPTYTYNKYSSWYLKKLNVQRLFRIWSNMIMKNVNMSIEKTRN